MTDLLEIKFKNADSKIDKLKSGQLNQFSVQSTSEVTVIEMEDINFHFDSAVLLPDYGTDEPQPGTEEQNRITGLGVLFACFKQAEKKEFLQKILIAGHTDKKGGEFYNLTLSQKRAENVFFMFMGERGKWTESSDDKNQVEDIQQILKWISFNFQYDCDPGPKTNKMNPGTEEAILKFQKRYNQDFLDLKKHQSKFSREFIRIKEDGKRGKQTWGAFFDMYTLELLIIMGITEDGLNELRTKLNFVKKNQPNPAPVIGCGENHPASEAKTEDENPVDRRVEILFFDDGEEPELKCHPIKFQCVKSKCDLYPKGFFKRNPVPVSPLPLPSGVAVRVHLKFVYKTPEGKERAFPKGFPYTLKFKDNTTEDRIIENDNGQVFLQVLREKKAFTIEFKFAESNFIASPDDESKNDELVKESQVKEKIKNVFKVFSLPLQWNLKNSSWELSPAVSNFDDTEKEFKDLDNLSIENIGSEASPINMKLDPKWQFLRFNYFDRFLKEQLSILPLLIEGFINSASSSGTPDSKSNWTTKTEFSHCLPWILIDPPFKSRKLLIQFNTEDNTFIESKDDGTRVYVSGSPKSVPNADRIRFYDMPRVWKSKNYFAKLSGGSGNPPTKEDVFEKIATETTSDDKPIIFSLDDIVLTDKTLKPITLTQNDRIAIFSNLFGEDPKNSEVSKLGIYKPDSSEPYFSQKVERVKNDKNYIADYPNWTRLVVCKGNLFEAFDQRLIDVNGEVVGCRAAVNWIDATNQTPDGVGKPPGNVVSPRPSPVIKNFFTIQPFVQQEYLHKHFTLDTGHYNFMTNPDIPSGNRGKINSIGRFDRALLRCCDAEDEVENTVILEYYKFSFDFAKAPDSLKNDTTKQDQFKKDTCINICKRWSQVDGSMNSGPGQIESKDPKIKLDTKVMWLSQSVPEKISHFKMDVVPDTGRSFMFGFDGTAELRISANKDEGGGKLVSAHECGHAGTLPDEYIETTTQCSYHQTSVRSNDIPGDFFALDQKAMMILNKKIRARYYWQVAEWLRSIIGGSYLVKHDFWEYEIQQHPNNSNTNRKALRNFTCWPRAANINTNIGVNKFDVLFYTLGEDDFSALMIDPGTVFKGIVLIMFNMKFEFPETPSHTPDGTFGRISDDLTKLNNRLEKFFNEKWKVSGKIDGVEFKPCMLAFSFRYLVETITSEDNTANKKYIKSNGGTTGKYDDLVEELEDQHDIHLKIEVIDPPTSKSSKLDGDELRLRSDNYNQFEKFIAQAMGIPVTNTSGSFSINKNSLLPIVRKVLSNEAIQDI
ncbi:MAG TPA: hypothetical protein VI362_03450 [Ignavibacteriaceae bacterium]|nr:hypothetical protein [Ignavibacteriaceae bacterium]